MASGATARLMVEIVGDASKAVSAFKQTGDAAAKSEGAAKKSGTSIAGLAKAVATGYVVSKVVAFGKSTVDAARESEVAHNRLVSTFKGAGDATGSMAAAAENYATKLGMATGVDDEAISGAEALLATFHSVSGAAGVQSGVFNRATAAAVDLAAAGYGDLNSNAVQLGKALEDPIKGMAALAKSGVTFTSAQKAAIQQMVKSGNHLGAQKVILANVESQVKGTAEATATGSAKMAVAWGNFKESVGAAILPVVDTIQSKLAGLFAFVSANSSWIVPLATGAAILIGVLLGVAKAIEVFGTVIKGAKAIMAVMRSEWIATNAAFLASPLGLIIIAVVALVAAIVILATKTNFFQTVWRALTSFMTAAWRATVGAITGAFNAAWQFIYGVFTRIRNIALSVIMWIRANWPLILGVLTGPFGLAVVLIMRNWSTITGFFSGIIRSISGIFAGVYHAIVNPFVSAFNYIRGIVNAAIGAIKAAIGGLTGFVKGAINVAKAPYNAFRAVWNGVEVAIKVPSNAITKLAHIAGKGFTFGLPDLPKLDQGGIVSSPTLALLAANSRPEAIIPLAALRRGGDIHVHLKVDVPATANPAETGRAVAGALRSFFAAGGRLTVPAAP